MTARMLPAAWPRRAAAYRALRRALAVSFARADFRVVSLAVRARRIELVVEADDRISLARGMQGFQVAAARHVNHDLGRRGQVFRDRYRARALRTRAIVRAVLAAGGWLAGAWPASWTGLAVVALARDTIDRLALRDGRLDARVLRPHRFRDREQPS